MHAVNLLPGEPDGQIEVVHKLKRAGILGVIQVQIVRVEVIKRLPHERADGHQSPDPPGLEQALCLEQRRVVAKAEADHYFFAARLRQRLQILDPVGRVGDGLFNKHMAPRKERFPRHRGMQTRGREDEHRVRLFHGQRFGVICVQRDIGQQRPEAGPALLAGVAGTQGRQPQAPEYLGVALANGAATRNQHAQLAHLHVWNPPSTTRLWPVT